MSTSAIDTDTLTISAADLAAAISRSDDVVIIEVHHQGEVDALRAQYDAGHIPGAHFAHVGTHFSGARTAESGNNPLPDADKLQQVVRDFGINDDTTVVVYAQGRAPFATRAWWVLRWGGLRNVRYLDGGIGAWQAAGGELSTEAPVAAQGSATVTPGALEAIDTGDIDPLLSQGGYLIDARPADAYNGELDEAGKAVAGHIPGAVSIPSGKNLTADGLLKSDDELREVYADALAAEGPVAVYCGGGVGSTLDLLALNRLGLNVKLYPGSFSAWAADPERPIATVPTANVPTANVPGAAAAAQK